MRGHRGRRRAQPRRADASGSRCASRRTSRVFAAGPQPRAARRAAVRRRRGRRARRSCEALRRGRSYVGLDALAPARRRSRSWPRRDGQPLDDGRHGRARGRACALARGRPHARRRTRVDPAARRRRRSRKARASPRRSTAPAPGVYRVEVRRARLGRALGAHEPDRRLRRRRRAARARRRARPGRRSRRRPRPSRRSTPSRAGPRSRPASTPSSSQNGRDRPDGRDRRRRRRAPRVRAGRARPRRIPTSSARSSTARPRDLTGRAGLVFSIRGDGAYRIWVQVRDANPASADEGTEWWFASRARPRPSGGAWPSRSRACARSTRRRTAGSTSTRCARWCFVLDKGSVKPGTAGTIWIDDLGIY